MDTWFVQNDDSPIVGPVTTEVLLAGVRAGRVPATARVRGSADPEWSQLSTALALAWPASPPRHGALAWLVLAAASLASLGGGLALGRSREDAEVRTWVARANAAEQKVAGLERQTTSLERRLRELEDTEEGMFAALAASATQAEASKTVAGYAAAVAVADRFLQRWPDSAFAARVRERRTALDDARASLAAKVPTSVSFDELHKLAATGMPVGKPYTVCAWYYVNDVSQLCAEERSCYQKQISIESDFLVGTEQASQLYDRRGKRTCLELKMFPGGGLAITGLR